METLIENSPAPSVEVPRMVRLRCWLRNLKRWKTGRAIRDLERAFWSDDGFVLTWKCHIAMTLIDHCGLHHDKANECADELMRALFGCKPNDKDLARRALDSNEPNRQLPAVASIRLLSLCHVTIQSKKPSKTP